MSQQRVLTIVPTYNEAENIERMLLALVGLVAELPGYVLDILVVDDNSPDGTAGIVSKFKQQHSNVHMIQGEKAGLGKAYLRGFTYGLAKRRKYDAFVMMDADFSHNPGAIPSMLKKIEQGEDYVIGSRYVPGGTIPGDWPMLRILNSRVANFMAHLLVDIDKRVTDVTGGFKVIRTSSLSQIDLSRIQASGYFFQVNLLHAFLEKGYSVAEVPITFIDRRFGVSKLKMKDITEFLYRAYSLNPDSSVRRLVRFCTVGLVGTVVNLAVLTLLVHAFGMSAFLADAIAIEVSIVSNFFMNHHYTFRFSRNESDCQRIVHKLLRYNVGSLGGALLSFGIFSALYTFANLHYVPADIIAIVIATGWNYWVSTRFVWKAADAGA